MHQIYLSILTNNFLIQKIKLIIHFSETSCSFCSPRDLVICSYFSALYAFFASSNKTLCIKFLLSTFCVHIGGNGLPKYYTRLIK